MLTNEFTRSSFCAADRPQCVEVALQGGVVKVGSTVTGNRIGFTTDEWKVFVDGVKAGEFDLPA